MLIKVLYWQVNLNNILAPFGKTPNEEESTGTLLIDIHNLREIFKPLFPDCNEHGFAQFQILLKTASSS